MVRPFRFGVQLSKASDGKAWRSLARQIEDLGYSSLFIPDHFGEQWGPLVALTVAAEATNSLKIGSLVFDNDFRHPVELAKEVATLSLASEGRFEFGIGAGWQTTDYDEAGIPYDRPGVRIERMVEGLQIMKDLWNVGTSTRHGTHYSVTNAKGFPRPFGDASPPIIIGGGGRRVLSIAAREADIVGFNPSLTAGHIGPEVAASSTVERYRQRVEWVRQAAGDRAQDLEFQCLTFVVQFVPDRVEVLEQMAPLFGVTPEQALEMPQVLIGTEDQIVETLQARREELGFSYWVVHEPEMEAFAAVVSRLAAT
jgi:probable F420-dependent oxidoreductase